MTHGGGHDPHVPFPEAFRSVFCWLLLQVMVSSSPCALVLFSERTVTSLKPHLTTVPRALPQSAVKGVGVNMHLLSTWGGERLAHGAP